VGLLDTALARRPPRVTLVNLSTRERLDAQSNPASIQLALTVGYGRAQVPGLTHEVLQYTGTKNLRIPMQLEYNAGRGPDALAELQKAQLFLQSAAYPVRSDDISGTSPPHLLIVWPNYLSLEAVITSLTIQNTQFNHTGAPVRFTARINLEEFRQARLLSDSIRRTGFQRQP
jgi:hypothetical protein